MSDSDPTHGAPQDEGDMMILAPYRSHTEIALYGDARVLKANCGHYAWLSPQGEPYLETSYTCCLDCAAETLADDNDRRPKRAIPGALDAVRRHLGDAGAERARFVMRQLGIDEG